MENSSNLSLCMVKAKKILLPEEYCFSIFGEIIRMEMYLENILVLGGGHFLSTVKL